MSRADATLEVLAEVRRERVRQEARWGVQNHPDGTGPDFRLVLDEGYLRRHGIAARDLEDWARDRCQSANNDGGDTYERILTEEWAEVLASPAGSDELRRELVQVAAVAVAWIEKLDREKAQT